MTTTLIKDLPLTGTRKLRTQIPNILKRNGIETVEQVCQYTAEDLMTLEYFGLKSLESLVGALTQQGQQLKQGI